MIRFSLAGSLWFVAFVAFGFAAVRNASDFWVGATFLTTLGLLCASVLGAVLERSRGGVWWLGFALFGWAYFVAGLIPGLDGTAKIPSGHAARWIFETSNRDLQAPPPTDRKGDIYEAYAQRQRYRPRMDSNARFIGHCLVVLIFARLGATVSCVFTKGLPWRRRESGDPRRFDGHLNDGRGRRSMGRISIAGILGLVAALAFGLAAMVVASDAWLGAIFTLTFGGLFVSVLGVLFRGWRGGGWLGFALFGWGYFLLATLGFAEYQNFLPKVAVEWIFAKANPYPAPPPPPSPLPVPSLVQPGDPPMIPQDTTYQEAVYQAAVTKHGERASNAERIGYWLSVQVFALAGAFIGVLFARRRPGDPPPAAP